MMSKIYNIFSSHFYKLTMFASNCQFYALCKLNHMTSILSISINIRTERCHTYCGSAPHVLWLPCFVIGVLSLVYLCIGIYTVDLFCTLIPQRYQATDVSTIKDFEWGFSLNILAVRPRSWSVNGTKMITRLV